MLAYLAGVTTTLLLKSEHPTILPDLLRIPLVKQIIPGTSQSLKFAVSLPSKVKVYGFYSSY